MKQFNQDVGEVDFSVTKECKFPVGNSGDGPLTLTLVHKSCFCTEAVVPGEIAPGQENAVILRWKPIPGGPQRIGCDIETNDPTRPRVHVQVQGVVNPLVRVAPEDVSFIDFDRLDPGAVKRRELKIFSTKIPAFDLAARVEMPGLKVTKTPLELDAGSRIGDARPTCAYSVIIETTPLLPPGYFTTDLVLTVKPPGEAARDIRMRIYGEVANGLFKVMPAEIEFKQPALAEGDAQKVRVQFIDPSKRQTLKIVHAEPSFLQCDEPRPLRGAAGQWEFSVRVPPRNPEAAKVQPDHFFEGRIVLQASDSDLQIPVRVKWIPPPKPGEP